MLRLKQATPARRVLWLVIGALLLVLAAKGFIDHDIIAGASALAAGLFFGGAALVQIIRGRRQG